MSDHTQWLSEYPKYTFNEYARHLKVLYGEPVYRISVDAGFSCPHIARPGFKGGCIYCDDTGSRAPYLGSMSDIESQILSSIDFIRARYGAQRYILYFQAFSNTNARPDVLERIYDSALRVAPFCELIVSTRPDCIDDEKAALLASYKNRGLRVWVELGLQSASEATLVRIRRGHTRQEFEDAYRILQRHGLLVAVHLIFGLPGEQYPNVLDTASYIAGLKPDGIKIHNLHIPMNTRIACDYEAGELVAIGPETHVEYVIGALELIPENTIIMRLTCDTQASRLLAPRRFWDKARFYSEVRDRMRARGTRQGIKYR